MSKTLYIDPIGGLAGDMLCAALLDAGLDEALWRNGLNRLEWTEQASIFVQQTMRGVFSATHVTVLPKGDVDTTAIEAKSHEHHHGARVHSHTHGQLIDHTGPTAVSWSNHNRGFSDIAQLIQNSPLPATVQQNALLVFKVLGEAEASIHGCTLHEVHFHEVGAVDSILDIVGFCYGLHLLDITSIIVGAPPLSSGTVQTAHGLTPLPAPATTRILRGWPSKQGHPNHEQVTPTGAAIVKALGTPGTYPAWILETEGYGAGTRNPPAYPNLVRVCIGCASTQPPSLNDFQQDDIVEIQSNIDDMPSEQLAPLIDHLLNAGAVDAHLQSIIMKKGRPGFLCTILCAPIHLSIVVQTLFAFSTTFGCRFVRKHRAMLHRDWDTVNTQWGTIDVKVGVQGNQVVQCSVEYEHAQSVAVTAGLPLHQVYQETLLNHRIQYPHRYVQETHT